MLFPNSTRRDSKSCTTVFSNGSVVNSEIFSTTSCTLTNQLASQIASSDILKNLASSSLCCCSKAEPSQETEVDLQLLATVESCTSRFFEVNCTLEEQGLVMLLVRAT
ncbi:hypothetical protein LINGRAHAP2_LOCUS10796 [Linum grandiflorum]